MTKLHLATALLSLAAALPLANAQDAADMPPASPTLAYDVASIKPNKTGSGSTSIHTHNGNLDATNVSLKELLHQAYDIREDLISGITGPIANASFDIQAKILDADPKAVDKLTSRQQGKLLLPILIDRFHLRAHTEIKTLGVYELVLVPGGAKFKQSAPGNTHGSGTSINGDRTGSTLTAHDRTMAAFADTLSQQLNRTVIDKTGLTGEYDFGLKWTRDDAVDPAPDAPPVLVTALQEQLGLKLIPSKGPVTTLVVDHVELPSEN